MANNIFSDFKQNAHNLQHRDIDAISALTSKLANVAENLKKASEFQKKRDPDSPLAKAYKDNSDIVDGTIGGINSIAGLHVENTASSSLGFGSSGSSSEEDNNK
jgi:hypothetical protein